MDGAMKSRRITANVDGPNPLVISISSVRRRLVGTHKLMSAHVRFVCGNRSFTPVRLECVDAPLSACARSIVAAAEAQAGQLR
jgi:hypothetical protein